MEVIFGGFKSFAILAVATFVNINSNEYFCPVGYLSNNLEFCEINSYLKQVEGS